MLRLLIKVSLLLALLSVFFLAVSAYSGGRLIRKAGDLVKRGAYQVARVSDAIREFTENLSDGGEDTAEEAVERIKEAKDDAKEDVKETSGAVKNAVRSTFRKAKTDIKRTFEWKNDGGK